MKNLILIIFWGPKKAYGQLVQWFKIEPLKWYFFLHEEAGDFIGIDKRINVWAILESTTFEGKQQVMVTITRRRARILYFLCLSISYVSTEKTEAYEIYGPGYNLKEETLERAALKYKALCDTGYFA